MKTSMPFIAVIGFALLVGGTALGQSADEALTVEIDVYSGRPNPKVTLTPAELAGLGRKIRSLCTAPDVATQPKKPYPSVLGYRGLHIARSSKAGTAHSMSLARRTVHFAKDNAPLVCQDVMQKAAGALYVDDANGELERLLIELAHNKGVISDDLYQFIVVELNAN
jgi:hypothetical protein